METIVSQRTLSVHKEHELLTKLEDAGLDDPLAQRIIQSKNNALGRRVVDFIRRGGHDASTDQKLARSIMCENFLGVEEVARHFGVTFTQKQMRALKDIPFTEAELQECRDTHLLVAGYPMTLLDVRAVKPELFYTSEEGWYAEETFASKEKVEVRWYLIRKDIVRKSTSKTWQEQQAMLADNEETPRACELGYAVILFYLATGKRLFGNVYARCTDVDAGGCRVLVGLFGANGLSVGGNTDGGRWNDVGVSASRKLPKAA